ncbi:MAG TPA: glutamine--fructose-6-phosphate transaminase (isomerizing) [Acidimicrobiales bacterium]|nr:glutamine--fructose-6-phosphate transaminase (isomerizing) [Acidimicrobiales bacterium]
MCGIVGYIGGDDAVPVLAEGLARLEYRGYDSAGVAVVGASGLKVHKRAGRVGDLVAALPKRLRGSVGIAHTRWATHGEPTDGNAHPHLDASGHVAVVHNGIVENAAELRAKLRAEGVELRSETDTEVIAQLVGLRAELPLEDAVREALSMVVGTYGLAVVDDRQPDRVVVARNGSPVVIGVGPRAHHVASDAGALVRHTDQVVHLDDHELAVLHAGAYRTFTLDARPTHKAPATTEVTATAFDLSGHEHFMHKEIHEQPAAVAQGLGGRLDRRFATAHLGGVKLSAREVLGVRRVKVLGCGSAYYAGLAGAQLVEGLSRIPADAETASEFRYRRPVIDPETLYVAVSQSGETFDTLAAVQEVKRKGGDVIGIVNAPGSSIAGACGSGVYIHAGPEVSVTSTKSFTATLVAFALLALHLGRVRDLGPADGDRLVRALDALPGQIGEVLTTEAAVAGVARDVVARGGDPVASMFYVGRVGGYVTALEGAQKLKEVSYIHAEAYPAAELKHGPLALVGPDVPTVVVLPDDDLLDKNLSTVEEIRARRGPVVAVTDADLGTAAAGGEDERFAAVLRVPRTAPELAPVLLGIPLQLLAYHTAVALGRDVDKPRNLAKSVTVE